MEDPKRREGCEEKIEPVFPNQTDHSQVVDNLRMTTKALRDRLIEVGAGDRWTCSRTDIYQNAISNLVDKFFAMRDLKSQPFSGAITELDILSRTLLNLFQGNIPLHITADWGNHTFFEGYSITENRQLLKVIINQKLSDSYSHFQKRTTRANCQIYAGEVPSNPSLSQINHKSIPFIRCGLRYKNSASTSPWTISIDSGLVDNELKQWQIIRPLSQAIALMKSPQKAMPYTYHFVDYETGQIERTIAAQGLWHFNHLLNDIFREMAKASDLQLNNAS